MKKTNFKSNLSNTNINIDNDLTTHVKLDVKIGVNLGKQGGGGVCVKVATSVIFTMTLLGTLPSIFLVYLVSHLLNFL
ncbi:MAG: hypothetical protein LBE18_08415 [Planctomycetaceae bacterium]|nr:hypothetical protein [Planctomycetaceae bacterium]